MNHQFRDNELKDFSSFIAEEKNNSVITRVLIAIIFCSCSLSMETFLIKTNKQSKPTKQPNTHTHKEKKNT